MRFTAAEFYALTPRQFDALARHHREHSRRTVEHREYLLGQLTAMVANTGFRGWKEPRMADEFMPSRHNGTAPRAPRINRQAVANKLRGVMAEMMARQNAKQNA